ncbi:MAG: hypothetical protein JET69_05535 [Methanomassiliicoccales archaeon]|nr:hypothetical protein [Methanomassiliicoccales archaeon]
MHKVIEHYHALYPNAEMRLGGIYASLFPAQIKERYPFIDIHIGLHEGADTYLPAYDILEQVDRWKGWDASIVFTSRGCIRKCPFCVVPKMEGKLRSVAPDIEKFIHPNHKKVILWDNNFLASPDWKNVLTTLKEGGWKVDFNQGLDARLIDEEKAAMLAEFKLPVFRMAYDWVGEKDEVTNAVDLLANQGIKRRNILFYCLYNFFSEGVGDDPSSFLQRTIDVLDLGCVSYPMRYEPWNSLQKNSYVSPLWTTGQLELIAKARRVIGFGGAFPPYEGLIKKLKNASGLDEAFSIRPIQAEEVKGHESHAGQSVPATSHI